MSAILDVKKASHRAQQQAGQGAGITLVYGCGQFTATFDCATRCAEILGKRELGDAGDGLYEVIPTYRIPLEDIAIALGKLTARYSVSLVDLVCDKASNRFVLVWKIPAIPATNGTLPAVPPTSSLDDPFL